MSFFVFNITFILFFNYFKWSFFSNICFLTFLRISTDMSPVWHFDFTNAVTLSIII